MKLLGAILAGGQSRRFGSDKALADLAGKPMVARVAAALSAYVDGLVLCGHRDPPPGFRSIADRPAPGLGPLGGLAGALDLADREGYAAVVSVGCDTPLLPSCLMARVVAAPDAAYVGAAPVIGRWPVGLSAALIAYLTVDPRRSVRGWAERIGAAELSGGEAIPNLNTPDQLQDFVAAHEC